MPVRVRLAETSDAAVIADLSRSTFYDSFIADNTKENMDKFMNEVFTRQALIKEVGAPGNIFILAEDGPDVVCYARLRESNQPPELGDVTTLEIARIYAATNAIGKGVGKALMEKSLAIAKELKKDIVWLGVWEHNQRAIGFYTKWGFEKFSTHVFLLGDDPQTDWLMKKSMGNSQ
ncbi:MAG TPA: GNAT family N-acetyltransferase [Chitinophagaceae bacterium]|jgi:ribosomal protein S18 acetylase RimI-like enzyme|nr:GNAT family N-acetyltransferase [Chitinophagaceae bacterium]